MSRSMTGVLLAAALVLGACGSGDDDAEETPDTEASESPDTSESDGGSGTEAGEPALGEEFTVESTGGSGEVVILAEDAAVTTGGGAQVLEVYVTATTPSGGGGGTLDTFLACGANFYTGKYFEATAPTPRFPIDQATEGFGLPGDTTVEGWLDLTLPMTPDGEVVESCDSGVQLVFAWGIFDDNGIIELPDDLVRELTGA